jgi:hypothetical protein
MQPHFTSSFRSLDGDVRYVGSFEELEDVKFTRPVKRESIRDALLAGASYPQVRMLEYLERGQSVVDWMSTPSDVLDPDVTIPGGDSIRTDGEWAWRLDLTHYVRRYPLRLPTDLVERAEQNSYAPPPVNSDQLRLITEEIVRDLGYRGPLS